MSFGSPQLRNSMIKGVCSVDNGTDMLLEVKLEILFQKWNSNIRLTHRRQTFRWRICWLGSTFISDGNALRESKKTALQNHVVCVRSWMRSGDTTASAYWAFNHRRWDEQVHTAETHPSFFKILWPSPVAAVNCHALRLSKATWCECFSFCKAIVPLRRRS